jgi:hypothetical protein
MSTTTTTEPAPPSERIITHWRRFSMGLWRVPEGDIAAAYSTSTLPKVNVFVHEGRRFTNGGCAFSKWLHAEADCYPLIVADEYRGAESIPYSHEGHEVAYRGKVFRLGAKIIFATSDPTVDEWRQSARVIYAEGGYFAAHCTYTEFIGNRFDPQSENGRAARFKELAECGTRAMPRTQGKCFTCSHRKPASPINRSKLISRYDTTHQNCPARDVGN